MSHEQVSEQSQSSSSPFNILLGGAGIGLLLAAASVAYFRSQKSPRTKFEGVLDVAKGKGGVPMNFKGKWALNTAIKLIEHDASRKVLLGVLKSIAKRAK
jgi:hypothetical protein